MTTPLTKARALNKILLIFGFIFTLTGSANAGVSVIVNSGTDIEALDTQLLSRIYAMQLRSWNNGDSIKVFVLPARNKIHRDFVVSNLKMQPHQLDRLWSRLIFTGTGRAPTVVKTELEMINRVRTTVGAIGYINVQPPVEGVKVVSGDGSHE